MIRYLSLLEILDLHRQIINQSGGTSGIRDLGALESAVAQPRMTFGGEDLYPTIVSKAVAIGFSLVMNHPFIDGNKRIGHAAMETFLVLNGLKINVSVDEQETVILQLASAKIGREKLLKWLKESVEVV